MCPALNSTAAHRLHLCNGSEWSRVWCLSSGRSNCDMRQSSPSAHPTHRQAVRGIRVWIYSLLFSWLSVQHFQLCLISVNPGEWATRWPREISICEKTINNRFKPPTPEIIWLWRHQLSKPPSGPVCVGETRLAPVLSEPARDPRLQQFGKEVDEAFLAFAIGQRWVVKRVGEWRQARQLNCHRSRDNNGN